MLKFVWTNEAVLDALGGVFFLNEAYAFLKRGKQGYDAQALAELMFLMDDEENLVTFAKKVLVG